LALDKKGVFGSIFDRAAVLRTTSKFNAADNVLEHVIRFDTPMGIRDRTQTKSISIKHLVRVSNILLRNLAVGNGICKTIPIGFFCSDKNF